MEWEFVFSGEEKVGRCNKRRCGKNFPYKERCCVWRLCAKPPALLNPFHLGRRRQFTFSSEPYPLTTALIWLYRMLNKEPTDLCFSGKRSITFSRKPPSEGNYVLGLPNSYICNGLRKPTCVCCVHHAEWPLNRPSGDKSTHSSTHMLHACSNYASLWVLP